MRQPLFRTGFGALLALGGIWVNNTSPRSQQTVGFAFGALQEGAKLNTAIGEQSREKGGLETGTCELETGTHPGGTREGGSDGKEQANGKLTVRNLILGRENQGCSQLRSAERQAGRTVLRKLKSCVQPRKITSLLSG